MSQGASVLETWFRRVWTEEDPNAIDEMFAPEAHATGLGDTPIVGPDEFKAFQSALLNLLGDVSINIDKVVDDGTWTACMCTMTATARKGGDTIAITGSVFIRTRDGKIIEGYNHFDFLEMFTQLGLLPDDVFERGLSGVKIA